MAYTEEQKETVKETILTEIASGKSLKSIIEANKDFPTRKTIYEWLNDKSEYYDEVFCDNYARAHEESADVDAEKVADLVDNTLSGKYEPAAVRVALDALKWLAGVKKPKKYGAKVDVTSGDKPIQNNTIPVVLSDGRTYEDLKRELQPE
jgi:hypothetical protein